MSIGFRNASEHRMRDYANAAILTAVSRRRIDMSDAILVLNAGSSSFKFTEFLLGEGEALEVGVSGNLEELYGHARFHARDSSGKVVGEHAWGEQAPPAARWRPGVLVRLATGGYA